MYLPIQDQEKSMILAETDTMLDATQHLCKNCISNFSCFISSLVQILFSHMFNRQFR